VPGHRPSPSGLCHPFLAARQGWNLHKLTHESGSPDRPRQRPLQLRRSSPSLWLAVLNMQGKGLRHARGPTPLGRSESTRQGILGSDIYTPRATCMDSPSISSTWLIKVRAGHVKEALAGLLPPTRYAAPPHRRRCRSSPLGTVHEHMQFRAGFGPDGAGLFLVPPRWGKKGSPKKLT
jgi:hypothetical protein